MTAREQAEEGLSLIKMSVLRQLASHPGGITSAEISRLLHLDSDIGGKQRNYLVRSILALLINDSKVRFERQGRNIVYFLVPSHIDVALPVD